MTSLKGAFQIIGNLMMCFTQRLKILVFNTEGRRNEDTEKGIRDT